MPKKKRGIYAEPRGTPKNQLEDKVADFSYESDDLARLVVDLWLNPQSNLINPAPPTVPNPTLAQYQARSDAAKAVLAAKGFYFSHPIVITEDEYEDGFNLDDAGLPPKEGVVFVVPRPARKDVGANLLETAKMLMAITPNGI